MHKGKCDVKAVLPTLYMISFIHFVRKKCKYSWTHWFGRPPLIRRYFIVTSWKGVQTFTALCLYKSDWASEVLIHKGSHLKSSTSLTIIWQKESIICPQKKKKLWNSDIQIIWFSQFECNLVWWSNPGLFQVCI